MGDRLFVTTETGSVACLNKADGKLLWIHSLTYHDFATEDERKTHPEVFAELDLAMAEQLKEIDQIDRVMPWNVARRGKWIASAPPSKARSSRCWARSRRLASACSTNAKSG